jgi:urea transport system substrate-binding protein
VFNTLNGDSNVAFFKELAAKGNTPDKIQTVSVSVAEEEVGGIGVENIAGHLVAWNYYQTTDNARNTEFVEAFKAEYGQDRVTADPIEAAYNAVHIWAAAAEKAGSFEVDAVKEAAKGLELETPEGTVTVHESNQHISKTARIGMVNESGLIDEVWSSEEPIVPDPCLTGYAWAEGLSQGECGPA